MLPRHHERFAHPRRYLLATLCACVTACVLVVRLVTGRSLALSLVALILTIATLGLLIGSRPRIWRG